jgi:hypothetical protein
MPRSKIKADLHKASQREFEKLLSLVEPLVEETIGKGGACENWSIKDILAHLYAWNKMYLTWYHEGMSSEKPVMPAPGYAWKTTLELSECIYKDHKDTPYNKMLEKLKGSHQKVMEIIRQNSDKELFTKKRYAWTGSTSLGSYTVSSASSHYDWANKYIKKFLQA